MADLYSSVERAAGGNKASCRANENASRGEAFSLAQARHRNGGTSASKLIKPGWLLLYDVQQNPADRGRRASSRRFLALGLAEQLDCRL